MERDRPFRVALVVAFLFHLSALTVFSIVVRFHKAEIPYSTLALVDSRRLGAVAPETAPIEVSSAPGLDMTPLQALPPLNDPLRFLPTNIRITIPSLTSSLRKYDEQSQPFAVPDTPKPSNDLWWGSAMIALQGAGKDIRHGIEQLALIGAGDSEKKPGQGGTGGEPGRLSLGGVADGYDASIEWISPPYDRLALFTPRIQFRPTSAVGKAALAEPLSLFVQINSDGAVTTVIPRPIHDPGGVVESVVEAVKRYQFEPLPPDSVQRDQTGTFTIEPVRPKE